MKNTLTKIRKNTEILGSKYFVDLSELHTNSGTIPQWKLTVMMFSAAMRKNTLLIGEPGWGKTSSAALIAAATTGLPLDLYRLSMIKGHPEQTEEKTIGRPDYGALMDKKERVVWQRAVYFPAIIFDEFNRLPEGKQSEHLDSIDTGIFTYLNEVMDGEKRSFFATANHEDGGNHEIIPPNKDRFHISLELNNPGAIYYDRVLQTSRQAKRDLNVPEVTKEILAVIADKDTTVEKKFEKIEQLRKKSVKIITERTGLQIPSREEIQELQKNVANAKLDADSSLFLRALIADFNYTPTYGQKRSCDTQRDPSEHAQGLASYKTKNGLSPRGFGAIQEYSIAAAQLLGTTAMIDLMKAIAPYCLSHRLQFDSDFRATQENMSREGTLEFHCAQVLVDGVAESYSNIKNDYKILEAFVTKAVKTDPRWKHKERFEAIIESVKAGSQDNPLLIELGTYIIKNHPSLL